MVEVHGQVDPGFERVGEAFAANFDQWGDVGASFSLYHEGTKVVDIWGGVADIETGAPWTEDTLMVVLSTTKGAAATCVHLLAQQGALDLDAPVATYWPEFAASGKSRIPVRLLLSHQAGLPAVDVTLSREQVLAWDPLVEALAAQTPFWEPGTKHGYHAFTFGHLVGEIVRRVSGRSIGKFFADEIATPLNLDFWIGLPASARNRVASMASTFAAPTPAEIEALPAEVRAAMKDFLDPSSLTARSANAATPPLDFGDPEVQAAEIPAGNGVTNARSVARLYASLIGEVDGVRIFDEATLNRALDEQAFGPDELLKIPSRFGMGYWLSTGVCPMGGGRSFGHPGAGGSLGFADPDNAYAFGYVMNSMTGSIAGDPRTLGLIEASKSSLGLVG